MSNEEQRKQHRRQRLLLPVAVLVILGLLVGGLVLAYRVAQKRLMPGGPTLVYRVDASQRAAVLPVLRARVDMQRALVRPGAQADTIEVLLPPVTPRELERVRGRVRAECSFAIYDVSTDPDEIAAAAAGKTPPSRQAFLARAAGPGMAPLDGPAGAIDPDHWVGMPKESGLTAVLVVTPPAFTYADLDPDAFGLQLDGRGGKAVTFVMKPGPDKVFLEYTRRRKGRSVAVAALGFILSVPKVATSIPGRGIIASPMGFAPLEAEDVASVLRAGPYPSEPAFVKLIPVPAEGGEKRVPTTAEEADSSHGQ